MNIKIKLKNSKYCNGCNFLVNTEWEYRKRTIQPNCDWYNINLGSFPKRSKIKRPKKCIKENGK